MENSEDFPFCTIITFSKGENVGQSRSSWKTVEIRRGRETSLSEPEPKQEPELALQTISPSSAFSNPIRMRNKVVFPVPEGLIPVQRKVHIFQNGQGIIRFPQVFNNDLFHISAVLSLIMLGKLIQKLRL